MRFKDFLAEETDKHHKVPKQAAEEFLKHCTQWKDVEVPLYRISTPSSKTTEDGEILSSSHTMRTRVPRTRHNPSRGGSRDVQEWLFNQPSWSGYPDRLQSIFCSTKKEFGVGSVDDHSENLLMIFPFDNVKMGITTKDRDFNYLNMMGGTSLKQSQPIMNFGSWVHDFYVFILKTTRRFTLSQCMEGLKKLFLVNGKFDPSAYGNESYAKRAQDFLPELKAIVMELEDNCTPEDIGCKIVTSSTIDLPGNTREVWFSGKYLSIPALDYKRFVQEVKALQAGEELPEKSTVKRVKQ